MEQRINIEKADNVFIAIEKAINNLRDSDNELTAAEVREAIRRLNVQYMIK